MGKGILIIIAGISIIITLLIMSLNSNNSQGTKTTVAYFDAMQARLISNSGIEIYLEKLRRDKTLTGTFLDNSLMNGDYNVTIWGPDTALEIKSIGNFNDVSHTSLIKARRDPVTLPPVTSSLYISANTLDMNLSGDINIDGNDHNLDTSAGPNPALPGIGVPNSGDSSYVVDDLKPKISNAILGYGSSPSVYTTPNSTNWEEITQDCIFGADTTVPSGTYSSGTFGNSTTPKITYMDGNVTLTGTASGAGVMIVNGNLSMEGNFTFYGIVIVYGKSQIDCKAEGKAGIYGASIFVGQSIDFQAEGKATFYYSSQAINNAKANLKSSRFQILSWWE